MPTTEQIDSFSRFAKAKVGQVSADVSIDDLFDEWRMEQPPTDDLLAIKASLRDLENGETGRPFADFADDFRRRNGIPQTP